MIPKTKSITVFLLTAILILTACKPKPGALDCPPLKLGILIGSDQTMPAQMQKLGYELALKDHMNSGSLNTCPVELIYADEGLVGNSDASQVALLNLADQGVVAILGATSNDATLKASALSKSLEIPLVVPSLLSDDLNVTDNQWIFRVAPASRTQADLVFNLVQAKLGSTANVTVYFEKTAFGENAAVLAAESAMDHGLKLVQYQHFTSGTSDFSTMLDNADKASTDILYFITNQPATADALVKSQKTLGLNSFQTIGMGYGFTDREFLYNAQGELRSDISNLLIVSPWAADLPWAGIGEFATHFEDFAKQNLSDLTPRVGVRNVEAYTALQFTLSAIQTVLFDPAAKWQTDLKKTEAIAGFREALRQNMHAKDSVYNTLMGPLSFSAAGQSEVQPVILQVRNGKLTTVFPANWAKESPILEQRW